MGTYPYPSDPSGYKEPTDNSTFDQYLSRQTPPVGPQGGEIQRLAMSESFNEAEERMYKYLKGTDYGAKRCFDQHFGEPGGSTYCFKKD